MGRLRRLAGERLAIVDLDERQSVEIARLRPLTRRASWSLGDRACLALASIRQLPVLTADRSWAQLDIGIQIEVVR